MYYHATQIPNLLELIPHTSNHKKPLVYLSSKRENVLVYLSNAIEKYYKGVSGYIYSIKTFYFLKQQKHIPFAFTTTSKVPVDNCEFILDAYEAIIQAEKDGKITIRRYENHSEKKRNWIRATMIQEYNSNSQHPEYMAFIKAKFSNVIS